MLLATLLEKMLPILPIWLDFVSCFSPILPHSIFKSDSDVS
jgi:hypothetical protein